MTAVRIEPQPETCTYYTNTGTVSLSEKQNIPASLL